ncbi:PilZ domain-containing protein [Thalassotalea sediminis]|uniref:PilZ domain-containing protein n=1 Tax=Thalassotalea sediminis TaxID=1759089 RepID=UPI002573FDB5|nr:PilZ domain-containing protein [Thalassotalea sediminis]
MTEQDDARIERRRSFRLDMEKELVNIQWQDDTGQEFNKTIACLDFSKGGLKLDCDQAIPLNVKATVIFKAAAPQSQSLTGQVVRCLKQDTGWYEIALRLDN